MFKGFHDRRRNESGFTLIELLVVILIVAILAAVAIPVFLKQREKGYIDQMESALKNAATAAESHATENNGSYAGLAAADCTAAQVCDAVITNQGFSPTKDVVLVFTTATATAYCITATHTSLSGTSYKYASAVGSPQKVGGSVAAC